MEIDFFFSLLGARFYAVVLVFEMWFGVLEIDGNGLVRS